MEYLGNIEKDYDITNKKYVDEKILANKGIKIVIQVSQSLEMNDGDLWYRII